MDVFRSDVLANGAKVVCDDMIVYTLIGHDPKDQSYAFCQHPTAHEDYEPTRPLRMDRIAISRIKAK